MCCLGAIPSIWDVAFLGSGIKSGCQAFRGSSTRIRHPPKPKPDSMEVASKMCQDVAVKGRIWHKQLAACQSFGSTCPASMWVRAIHSCLRSEDMKPGKGSLKKGHLWLMEALQEMLAQVSSHIPASAAAAPRIANNAVPDS